MCRQAFAVALDLPLDSTPHMSTDPYHNDDSTEFCNFAELCTNLASTTCSCRDSETLAEARKPARTYQHARPHPGKSMTEQDKMAGLLYTCESCHTV